MHKQGSILYRKRQSNTIIVVPCRPKRLIRTRLSSSISHPNSSLVCAHSTEHVQVKSIFSYNYRPYAVWYRNPLFARKSRPKNSNLVVFQSKPFEYHCLFICFFNFFLLTANSCALSSRHNFRNAHIFRNIFPARHDDDVWG